MKRFFITIMAITLICMNLCSCGKNENVQNPANSPDDTSVDGTTQAPIPVESNGADDPKENPLENKEYAPLVISTDGDFLDVFNNLNEEYSSCILSISDYCTSHTVDIEENGMGFSDFDDYETELDDYYEFLYKVMYCESGNVPEEYKDAWSLYKTTIWQNKTDLDNLYLLKGQDLIDGLSEMMTSIQAGSSLVAKAMPSSKIQDISIGDTIQLDFLEMTLEEIEVTGRIIPPDTSREYLYFDSPENEQYYCLTGTLKNLSGDTFDASHIYVKMVFDDTYNYTGRLEASNWDSYFNGENVKPLGNVKYYIYSSVPNELLESFSKCIITFGFADSFGGDYFLDEEDCDYLFAVTASK